MPTEIPGFDLYATLEVDQGASVDVITASWKALQKQHYPRAAGQGDPELSRRLNIAYEWLSDAALRARYDAARPVAHTSGTARPREAAGATRSAGQTGAAPPPTNTSRTHAWPPKSSSPTSSGTQYEPPRRPVGASQRPSLPPTGLSQVLQAPLWQRRVSAFAGAMLVPMALVRCIASSGGDLLAVVLAVALVAYPIWVVVVAITTDRFSDAALRDAGRGLQWSAVVVIAVGLVSPVLLALSILLL